MSFTCKKLYSVVWELTLRCNARCVHCGSSAGKDRPDNLTFEQACSVVQQLAQANCQEINLIGGEYFLYQKWRELILEIKKTPINVKIITNGLLLTDSVLDFLKENDIKTLGISIDGFRAETHDSIRRVPGCFERALDAVKRSFERQIPTTVITTINRLNIAELKQMRTLFLENNVYSWQVQHTNLLGSMQEKYALDDFGFYIVGIFCAQTKRLYSSKQFQLAAIHCMGYYSQTIPSHTFNRFWMGCPAGKKVLGIRSNGDVVGCLSIYNDDYIEGNLKEKSLKEIRKNKDFCSWNRRLERFKSLSGFCKDCPFSLACLGGCTSFEQNQKHCYFAIEQKMKKITPKTEVEKVLKALTTGHMDKNGRFFLKNRVEITTTWIDKLPISDEYKKQLAILVID